MGGILAFLIGAWFGVVCGLLIAALMFVSNGREDGS